MLLWPFQLLKVVHIVLHLSFFCRAFILNFYLAIQLAYQADRYYLYRVSSGPLTRVRFG